MGIVNDLIANISADIDRLTKKVADVEAYAAELREELSGIVGKLQAVANKTPEEVVGSTEGVNG